MPLLLALLLLAPSALQSARPVATTTYQVVLFKPGPAPPDPAVQMDVMQQSARIADLIRKRTVLMYGLVSGGSRQRASAVAIVPAADADAARRVFADDPLVQHRMVSLDVKTWMGPPKDWFGLPTTDDLYNLRTADFVVLAFVLDGPNRSQDAETAAKLDAAHRAYMDSQRAGGPLVLAGPFLDGAPERGMLVYRTRLRSDAQVIAWEQDAAIRAERLGLELYQWLTLPGILK